MALFRGPVGNNLVLTNWGGRTGWSHQLSPFLVPAFHLSVYYFNFLLCPKVIIVHKQWVGMLHATVWLGAGEKQLSCQVWEHGPAYKQRAALIWSSMFVLVNISSFASQNPHWALNSWGEMCKYGKACDCPKCPAELGGLYSQNQWVLYECLLNRVCAAQTAAGVHLDHYQVLGLWQRNANVKGNPCLTLSTSGSYFLCCSHSSTHWLTAKCSFCWTRWPCVIDLNKDQLKRLG